MPGGGEREGWHAAVRGVARVRYDQATEKLLDELNEATG